MTIPGIAAGVIHQGSLTPDNLIAGSYPRVVRIITVTGGVILPAGAVLGEIEADGRFQLSDTSLANGAQVPDAILAEAVDATLADVQAHAFFAGEFNVQALTLGPGHTLATVVRTLRLRSLFLRNNQS